MVERLDDEEEPRRLLGRRSPPRSPRHVKAVPTNAQLKIGRALELFNASEHPRTVAGIARSLGIPHASASTSKSSAAEVLLTVAWELSWYQFGVDLSDGREPVRPAGRARSCRELPDEAQDWNCTVDEGPHRARKRLRRGAGPTSGGPEAPEQRLRRWTTIPVASRGSGPYSEIRASAAMRGMPSAMGPGRSTAPGRTVRTE